MLDRSSGFTASGVKYPAAFFAAIPLRVAAPALAGWTGWPVYFAATLPLYAAAVVWLASAVDRTLRADGAAR